MSRSSSPLRYFFTVLVASLLLSAPVNAIKFEIQAYRYPPAKCIWNTAHKGALVIVTANVGPGEGQRLDIEIVDSGPEKNVYLNKRGIVGEARFAITAHNEEGDVGVCFRNYLDVGALECANIAYKSLTIFNIVAEGGKPKTRIIDLDVDIGADAVDYKCARSTFWNVVQMF